MYCIAESLDRKMLDKKLKERGPRFLLHSYAEVLYGQYGSLGEESSGDVFYFDYGCGAFWGMSEKQEQDILQNVVRACVEYSLSPAEF